MPKLLFLNRCYWPDTEATGQLLTDLCESLAADFDVHVVCGQPNSPAVGQSYNQAGVQMHGGVTVHRLRHIQFAKRVPAGRLMNLVSFSRAANTYLRRTSLAADCLISETDPFLLPMVAAKHKRRVGAQLVCYLQDIYPDVAEAIGKAKSGLLTKLIRLGLRNAYQASEKVIVLGECMKSRLQSSPWSIDFERLQVIPNWADCQAIIPIEREHNSFLRHHGLHDRFVVMHSGNMGLTQRLDVLLDATAHPSWPAQAVLLIVGDGAAKRDLQSKAESLPSDRVRFLPYQPRQQLAESLSAADLHVVSMHESISGCLCPSKLYGILAAGRPVLAIASPQTDLVTTVEQNALGAACSPGNGAEIAHQVARFCNNRQLGIDAGRRARAIALAKFDRPIVIEQFRALLGAMLAPPITTPSPPHPLSPNLSPEI